MSTNPWAVEAPASTCPVRRLVQRFGVKTVVIVALGIAALGLFVGGVNAAYHRTKTESTACSTGSHHVVMQVLPGVSMSSGARQATTISECVPND